MATPTEITQLRRQVDEPTETEYSDSALGALIDEGSLTSASYRVWAEKAGRFAGLVNVSEAGSSQSLSDLHKNALKMADHYGDLLRSGSELPSPTSTAPTVTRIVRP